MSKYFINECKCGISKGGMGCGPIDGIVNAAVKFTVDGKTLWLINSEVVGLPNFYITTESIFERFMEDDFSEEFGEIIEKNYIKEFDGISLDGYYLGIVESLKENEKNPAAALIKFVIALTRCEYMSEEELIKMGTGHYAEEIEIPFEEFENLF